MTGTTHKTTAVALQNRRLATVTKKRGIWKAEPTPAGRHFAAHGSYPDGHWRSTSADQTFTPTPPPRAKPQRPVTGLRPTEQLVADVVAAGGRLELADIDPSYYDNLVRSANRHGKVPAGQRLEFSGGWRKAAVTLTGEPIPAAEEAHEAAKPIIEVPVAEQLRRLHPAVASARQDKTRLAFKGPVRNRALRVLDALAKEAVRRGYEVSRAEVNPRGYRGSSRDSDLVITIGEHDHALSVVEDTDRTPHEPTARELEEAAKPFGRRIPKYDHTPSGRLTVHINGGLGVRQSHFGDTKTYNLENRLGEILQEIEGRAAASEARRLERIAQAEAEKRAWEEVRDQAILDATEAYYAKVLAKQAERWERANELARYLDAMAARIESLDPEPRAAGEAWLAWSRTYVASLSPLAKKLRMPEAPKLTTEDIKPFMRGLSPYGPRGY